jgi:antitoxin component of RelBE/YafQ-DinJ toxin-antitoxin module
MSRRITGDDVVRALKRLRKSSDAKQIAAALGIDDTRAVATAARRPVKDGRITINYRGRSNAATYRFVRIAAQQQGGRADG